MSLKQKRNAVSVIATFLFVFLCYALYPRPAVTTSGSTLQPVTLVIDAGHGGEDGGAVSASGVLESKLNLAIALKAEDLAALVGMKPRMIRRTDVSVYDDGCTSISQKKNSDLRNRAKFVENTPGAVLLSIHQNHFSEEKYHGAQVFYASTPGSEALAKAIQTDLRDALDKKNHRECKRAQSVYLLEHVSCPAILVECGFLSNSAEAQKLQEDTYQKKLAMAILRSIAQAGKVVTEESEI